MEVAERIAALKGHQQQPSTSQSGPYLRNSAVETGCIYPLLLCSKSQTSLCTCTKTRQYSQKFNRHPSTINGYRTAIVDTLGPVGLPISQSLDLNRLLSSFHRDRPKSSRNLPKWNLSVVFNVLTKAPFEPIKDTDLKHLTLKKLLFC